MSGNERQDFWYIMWAAILTIWAISLIEFAYRFQISYGDDQSVTSVIIYIVAPLLLIFFLLKKWILTLLFGNITKLDSSTLKHYYLEFFTIYRTLATVLILGLAILWGLGEEKFDWEEFQAQTYLLLFFFSYVVVCLLNFSSKIKHQIEYIEPSKKN